MYTELFVPMFILSAIVQVCCLPRNSPLQSLIYDARFLRGIMNSELVRFNDEDMRSILLSRQKRDNDDPTVKNADSLTLLKALQSRQTEPEFDIWLRNTLYNGNNMQLSKDNRPEIDQYKKVVVTRDKPRSDNFKKMAEELEMIRNMNLADDVKQYVINDYLTRVWGEETSTPWDGNEDEEICEEDYYRYDEIKENPKNNTAKANNRKTSDAVLEEQFTKDMVGKNPKRKINNDDRTLSEQVFYKELAKLAGYDGNLEEFFKLNGTMKEDDMEAESSDNVSTYETSNNSFKITIDLKDKTIKNKDNNDKTKIEQIKPNNDIRIKIQQEVPPGSNASYNPPEVKIVIKLPENDGTTKFKSVEPYRNSEGKTYDDVRDEIKDYVSLALSILKQIEDESGEYNVKSELDDSDSKRIKRSVETKIEVNKEILAKLAELYRNK